MGGEASRVNHLEREGPRGVPCKALGSNVGGFDWRGADGRDLGVIKFFFQGETKAGGFDTTETR